VAHEGGHIVTDRPTSQQTRDAFRLLAQTEHPDHIGGTDERMRALLTMRAAAEWNSDAITDFDNTQADKTPLAGAGGPNPYCANFKPGENNAEDPQSVGIYITFGKFRTVHLGDLTKNKEFELMCPNNRLGTVDALLGLHHGQASSNSPVLVHALHPLVAIMNNGTRKGGEREVMQTVHSSPGLESLAVTFLIAERPGIHGAGNVYRQHCRSAAADYAHRSNAGAATRTRYASTTSAQWHSLLDQAVGTAGRFLHSHECSKRLQQDLHTKKMNRCV
jgi:hypothetical protein